MSELDEWAQPASDTTIAGLKQLSERLVLARESKDTIAAELKGLQEVIDDIEIKILNILKENALPSFKSEFGTISIKNNKSITQPEDLAAKRALFGYLQEQGIFEEMVSVNSRTLNSWANKEIEAKESNGVFGWVPPGLKPPSEYQTLALRKK